MKDFDTAKFWATEAEEHLETARKTFDSLESEFMRLIDICAGSIGNGGKVLFFGNGGSAADAQHLATELTVRYISDRVPIPAIALTTDTSALTAIGNDFGFEHLFARQINALGQSGDVAIGISTSGTSANILKGLQAAHDKGLITVGFSGRDGGDMGEFCDLLLVVPSHTTARIQEMHITLGQMLCGALEKRLGLI
ncbi:MAG: D-sedoheptulose 7-phosphate isomerase [Alphaproteobacteria bacterium]|nr:D-sedoheptulose 7-phosphate isomerase [Alphaproteobacteria bacterium]